MLFLKNKKKMLFNLGIFLLSAGVMLIYTFYTKNTCFVGDDFWYTRFFDFNELFHTLSFEKGCHGGGYIGYFLCEFFSFAVPLHLNIHPNDFVSTYHAMIKSIFFILFLLLISKFSVFHNRSKALYICTIMFLAFYTFDLSTKSYIMLISYNFYRYLFSLIPLSILLYSIYKNSLVNYNKLKLFELIIVCFSAYFVGSSLELIFYITLFFAVLLVSYNIIIYLISKYKKTTIDFEKLKLNLDYRFYIPISIMSIAIYLFTSSSGYKHVASIRGMENINISLELFNEFVLSYWEKCFCDIWLYWILFIPLLITSAIFMYRKNEIKKIVFPVFFIISILTVMFSLILCGKTFTDCEFPTFFLYHHNILAVYKLLILYPFLILLGYLYKIIKKKHKKNILLFLLIYSLYLFYTSIVPINVQYNDFYEFKKEQYMIEKIMRFYHLKNETAIVTTNNFPEMRDEPHRTLLLNSMNFTYKDNLATTLGYIIQDDAVEKFYEKGGIFTEKELKELKFEELKNNNFILNKKEAI